MKMNKGNPSTEILKNRLLQSENIEDFIETHHKNLSANTFKDYIYALIEHKGLKISEALGMAQMSESYGYQLFNGKRQPSRDKVIQLALGLGLSLSETNRLLKLSGKSELYVKEQRDAVFMFALNKKWSLFDVEELLLDRNLECLIKK
ncbi:MAG: XRE family transcriptional regulator [Clostridia bacterium]|nr:XRE family transcriptional regulator [Clostridia bacterium]